MWVLTCRSPSGLTFLVCEMGTFSPVSFTGPGIRLSQVPFLGGEAAEEPAQWACLWERVRQ